MQGTSKWVPDQFQQGDIIHSVDEEKLGGKGDPVLFIPFMLRKTWQIFAKEGDTQEWVREEPWHAANDHLDWQFTEDNDGEVRELFRHRNYGFYSILVNDIEGGYPIPVLVNFRSSAGFKQGKKIASHFAIMKGMNREAYNVVWSAESESHKEPGKAYQKYLIKKAANASEDQMNVCVDWVKLMATASNIKTHDVDEEVSGQQNRGPVNSAPQPEQTVSASADY